MQRTTILLLLLIVNGCYSSTVSVNDVSLNHGQKADANPFQITEADRIRQSACQYLWQQQRADGSWGSEKYGILKSGQAYTPFVLCALLRYDHNPSTDAIDKALDFMRSKISEGAIGRADPDVMEYPVYSTAYALMCFKIAGIDDDQSLIQEMEEYLVSEQFTQKRGFDPDHYAYGGWGFGGDQPVGKTGHMDLAHVRRVLDALAMKPANTQHLAEAQTRAEVFLRMVQKHPDDPRRQPLPEGFEPEINSNSGFDGGFYFSPVILRANKGRLNQTESPYWNSYATTTCDGLLALLSANVAKTDNRVRKAVDWLVDHPKLEHSQGIPEFYEGKNWRDAVMFYHLSVRGEVARALGKRQETRNQIASILSRHQNPDGSFVNRLSGLMKEDDPIMTTTLAVVALGRPSIQVDYR